MARLDARRRFCRLLLAEQGGHSEPITASPEDDLTEAEEEALHGLACDRVWDAFNALPSKKRRLVTLRVLEDKSLEETAEALEVTVWQIRRMETEAFRRLREGVVGQAGMKEAA